MNSLIFRTAAGVIIPVVLVLSVIVLLRGHNEPGGGFVGGLLASAAFSLRSLAYGTPDARMLLRIDPRVLIGVGMLVATLSGFPALISDKPYLEGLWFSLTAPGFSDPLKVGTPLAFDVGVYLIVLGGTALMVLTLQEVRDESRLRG